MMVLSQRDCVLSEKVTEVLYYIVYCLWTSVLKGWKFVIGKFATSTI